MMSEAGKLTGQKRIYENLRITWWIDKNMRGIHISFTNLIFHLQFRLISYVDLSLFFS